MNPRDPRTRRNRPLADAAARLEESAEEFRAQVVRLPVDNSSDLSDATEWVVPRWTPPVPAYVAGAQVPPPVVEEPGCVECGGRLLEGACLSGCWTPDPEPQPMPEVDPCRGCGITDPDGRWHVYGERKCCPDCDHRQITETAGERLFGWSSVHDERSLKYAVRDRLRRRVPVQSLLRPVGPILDQGTAPPLSVHDASGCTGFAGIAAANALHGTTLGEAEARDLYELAQKRDDYAGEAYPGAPVIAVMKAGVERGYWAAYWWCFGTRDLAQAVLQIGPVLLGVVWSDGCNHPDPDGVIVPGGPDVGGHAILAVGIELTVAGRPGPWFVLQQSYGPSVGRAGLLFVHHKDLARMLAGRGEAAIPLTEQQLAAL